MIILETQYLEMINQIHKFENMTKAAEVLHVSQPALSHKLKKLESLLGLSLFHRINKKMIITDAGRLIHDYSKDILAKISICERKIAQMTTGEIGEINISTECHTIYPWLPKVLSRFYETYPKINIQIKSNATPNPVHYLQKGELDIAILNNPKIKEDFDYVDLPEDEMVAVFHEDHHFNRRDYIIAEDMNTEHFLMYNEAFENSYFAQKILIPKFVVPKQISKFELTEIIISMIQSKLGVSVFSKWLITPYLKNSSLKTARIGKNGLFRSWKIALIKDEYRPAYITHLVTEIQKAFRSISKIHQ